MRRSLNDGVYDRPIRDGRGHDGFEDVMHARRPVGHGASDFQLRQPGGTHCSPDAHEGNHWRH